MKHALITLTVAALAGSALARKPQPEASYEPWLYFGEDFYPSAIVATATVDWHEEGDAEADDAVPVLGDDNGWLGVFLYDVPKGASIRVELAGDGWLKPSKLEVTAKKRYDEVLVVPKAVYDFDALLAIRQQKPVNLSIKVAVNDEDLGDTHETLIMRSINECPWAVLTDEESPPDDLSWLFAAYVNENHPWIDGLLKDALQTGIVDSFTGYQSGDPDEVGAQVFAVWHTLQRRGIRYSDISKAPRSRSVASQVVRFMDDSVKATQANCVDGSVLLASILTKIGIHAHLVLVPGHCFLAFETDPNAEDGGILGLETTMLGADKLESLEEMKKNLDKVKNAGLKARMKKETEQKLVNELESSQKTFLNALAVGSENLDANWEQFEEEDNMEFELVSIADARDMGIMPIASGREQ